MYFRKCVFALSRRKASILFSGVGSRPEEIHSPQKPTSEVRVCLTWWQACGVGDRTERSTFGRQSFELDTPVSTGMFILVRI